jgi:hypothetical protein
MFVCILFIRSVRGEIKHAEIYQQMTSKVVGGRGTSNTSYPFSTFTIGRPKKADPMALPLTKPITRSQTQSQTQARNILVSEPSCEMTEPRIERLEKEMGSMDERLKK